MPTIVLAGGNEFQPGCVTMDVEVLKSASAQPPRVVVVPTANRVHPDLAAAHGVRYFEGLGAVAAAVNVVDRHSANDLRRLEALQEADLIYFAGGDPWYLLDSIRDSLLLTTLRDLYADGRVIAGASAGAMVLAERMPSDDWSAWIRSLALSPGVGVIPHHDQAEAARIRRLREEAGSTMSILGIDEATACIGDGRGTWRVAGVGGITVYRGDRVDRYSHGETFATE